MRSTRARTTGRLTPVQYVILSVSNGRRPDALPAPPCGREEPGQIRVEAHVDRRPVLAAAAAIELLHRELHVVDRQVERAVRNHRLAVAHLARHPLNIPQLADRGPSA